MSRNESKIEEVCSSLEGSGHQVVPCDMLNLAQVEASVESLNDLDGLVHFAGARITAPLRSTNLSDVEALFKVNTLSGFALAKAFRKKGVSRKPSSIVLISSAMGIVGAKGVSAYCSTKSAVIGMTKALAVELAPERITVNCIAPGFVRTQMWDVFVNQVGVEQIEDIEKAHPLGIGETDDVSNAAIYLLSSAAKWITGTCLVVDGGYCAQ